MKRVIGRYLVVLSTGYIFLYYSELAFWASYDPVGMAFPGIVVTWLGYSLFAFLFLCIVDHFRVRTVWSLFLAAAAYGWLVEGVFAQTMYLDFPVNLSWTGLAWHATLTVLVGWYQVRRVLVDAGIRRILLVAAIIGAVYGLWAVFWWLEPGHRVKALVDAGRTDVALVHFALYALVTTVVLIIAYWVEGRTRATFAPSRGERWVLVAFTALYYGVVVAPAHPHSLLMLPPLLGLVYLALRRNRRDEHGASLISAAGGRPSIARCALLIIVAVVALAIYAVALALGLQIPSNYWMLFTTTPLGALLFIASVIRVFRRRGAVAS